MKIQSVFTTTLKKKKTYNLDLLIKGGNATFFFGFIMKIKVIFEEGDLASFHDVLYDLTGHSYTDDELKPLFLGLPDNIKGLAYMWGPSDSEFRDSCYTHFKKQMEKKGVQSWDAIEKNINK